MVSLTVPVTTITFQFPPIGTINVAFGEAEMMPGIGAHRLVIPVKVACSWLTSDEPSQNTPVLVVGEVWTALPNFRWLAGLQPQVLVTRRYQLSESLVLSLTDDQLIALERVRGDGEIGLNLKLQASLLSPVTDEVHPVASQEVQYRISRSRWLELLDRVGTEVGIVIRVPSPLTDSEVVPPTVDGETSASLAQAVTRLRKARAELRDGQWENCVATCRQVLENVDRLVSIPAQRNIASAPQGRSQADRWAAIYYDLKSMASAAHHDDATTDGFVWDRADAEAILAASAGLLLRYTARVH